MTQDTSALARTDSGRLLRLSNDCLLLLVGRTGIRVGAEFIRGLDAEVGLTDLHGNRVEIDAGEGPADGPGKGSMGTHGGLGGGPQRVLRRSTFYLPPDRGAGEDDLPRVRAVALDLDSKTVDEVGLRDRLAGCLNYTGGGAEMLWPQGFHDAERLKKEITGVLDAAGAGSVRNFLLFHSTSQGTGSGVGSWIVDHLRARYCIEGQRRNLLTFTIVPSGGTDEALPYKEFEEVSGPSYYNTVMALNTLFGIRPGQPRAPQGSLRTLAILMDNPAIARAYEHATGRYPRDPAFGEINRIIARTALALTALLRYGPTDIGNVMVNMADARPHTYAIPSLSPIAPWDTAIGSVGSAAVNGGEANGHARYPGRSGHGAGTAMEAELLDGGADAGDAMAGLGNMMAMTPFALAFDALVDGHLLQGAPDPERVYFVLRGNVDRAGVRHVNDLYRDRFGVSADFFHVIDRAYPGVPAEMAQIHRPRRVPSGIRRVMRMAREGLTAGRHLQEYTGWGLSAETIQTNISVLERYLHDALDAPDGTEGRP